MFVLYDGPKNCFFPKVTLSEIRWSMCSCQKFRWVVRSEELLPTRFVRQWLEWIFRVEKRREAESKRNGLNLNQIASWKTCSYMFMIFELDCWLSNISGVDLICFFYRRPVHLYTWGIFFPKGWWVSWLVRLLDMDVCGFLKPFKGFRKFRRLHTERCLEAIQESGSIL